jgi:hypothetical protein
MSILILSSHNLLRIVSGLRIKILHVLLVSLHPHTNMVQYRCLPWIHEAFRYGPENTNVTNVIGCVRFQLFRHPPRNQFETSTNGSRLCWNLPVQLRLTSFSVAWELNNVILCKTKQSTWSKSLNRINRNERCRMKGDLQGIISILLHFFYL